MQQLRKDNHYVPKVYLKQWAHKGRISTYRLLVSSENTPLWKEQSLRGIAFHKHLYTYLSGQAETDEFERWLDSEFESPAEKAIQKVVNEERLSPEDWKKLVRFAVALDVRTPASLKQFLRRQNEQLQDLLDETLHDSIRDLESALSRKEVMPLGVGDNESSAIFNVHVKKKPDGEGEIRVEALLGRRLWIWQMRHLLSKTLERIPTKNWTILHAPTGVSWPTSDNPLIRLNFKTPSNYDFNGGWGVKNGDIILPLSPRHLLFCSIGNKPLPRGTVLDINTTQLLFKFIIEHADRYIFSQNPIDIHQIRPRLVCPRTYESEQAFWLQWHREQCQLEREFQNK